MQAVWPSPELEKEMLADAKWSARAGFPDIECHVKDLLARIRELEQVVGAFAAAMHHEFAGKESGDVLSDFGVFLEHHKAKETRIRELEAELQRLHIELPQLAWDMQMHDFGGGTAIGNAIQDKIRNAQLLTGPSALPESYVK